MRRKGETYQSLGTRVDDRHEHAGHGEPGARIFAVKVAEADDAKALGDDHAEDTDGGLDRENCEIVSLLCPIFVGLLWVHFLSVGLTQERHVEARTRENGLVEHDHGN